MKQKRIFVAGHERLVGSAIVRALQKAEAGEIIVSNKIALDWTNQKNSALLMFFSLWSWLLNRNKGFIYELKYDKTIIFSAHCDRQPTITQTILKPCLRTLVQEVGLGWEQTGFWFNSDLILPPECVRPIRDSLVSFGWAIKYLLRNKKNFDVLEGLLSELLRQDVTIGSILDSESNQYLMTNPAEFTLGD